MGISRHEDLARELLRQHGVYQRQAKHGELWMLPGGRLITLPTGSPADTIRCWRNCYADIRRALRHQGLLDEEEVVMEKEGEVLEKEEKREILGLPDLETLGVYVQTTAEEIRRETHELTLDTAVLAKLMGFHENVKRVSVVTETGDPTEAPITVVIHTERIMIQEKTVPASLRYHKPEERSA